MWWKLRSQSTAVRAELLKVFGEEVQFPVEVDPPKLTLDQDLIITLGVLLALSVLMLIITQVQFLSPFAFS